MNPTQEQLNEMYAWFLARKSQQIAYPLDEASRNSLGAAVGNGAGSVSLTQTITIGPGGGSANVPASYAGSLILNVQGVRYEIGYIRTL